MRYILVRCKGQPPKERPVGMGDILFIAEYQSVKNALRYMRPDADLMFVLRDKGWTHLGLYESPALDLVKPDPLVATITL